MRPSLLADGPCPPNATAAVIVVFDARPSLIFKTLQVVPFFDRRRNELICVAYRDRFIKGSAKNSIRAPRSWRGRSYRPPENQR